MGNKILIAVVVFVLILGAVFYWQYGKEESGAPAAENKITGSQEKQNSGNNAATVSLPPATGDVDSLVDSLFSASSGEDQILSQDDDVSFVGSDAQAISDFGVAYDENNL